VREHPGIKITGFRQSKRQALLGELADLCPQGVVLGDGPGDAVLGQVVLQVADPAQQLADPAALGGDLAPPPPAGPGVRMLLEVAKAPVARQGVRPGRRRGDGRLAGRVACPGTGDRVSCWLPGPNGKLLAAV
jgi:hypothetical protein